MHIKRPRMHDCKLGIRSRKMANLQSQIKRPQITRSAHAWAKGVGWRGLRGVRNFKIKIKIFKWDPAAIFPQGSCTCFDRWLMVEKIWRTFTDRHPFLFLHHFYDTIFLRISYEFLTILLRFSQDFLANFLAETN